MKKSLFILTALLFFQNSFSQVPIIEWKNKYGGTGEDKASCIRQTTDGGFIIAGTSNSLDGNVFNLHIRGSSAGTNYQASDLWIVKIDNNGLIQWSKCFGGQSTEETYDIQQTFDGGYIVVGQTSSSGDGDLIGVPTSDFDFWIVKLNAIGLIQWHKTGKSYSDFLGTDFSLIAYSIQQTADGGYVIVGTNYGSIDTADIWVIKLSSSGTFQWQKKYGGSGFDSAVSIRQTPDGGYIMVGVTNSVDGDFTGIKEKRAWVIKLDNIGTIQWKIFYYNSLAYISLTNDGGYIVGGTIFLSNSDYDYWILKLNSDGIIQWQKKLGGSSLDYISSIEQTKDGGYIVGGVTYSYDGDVTRNTVDYGSTYWIVKLDASGSLKWQRTIESINYSDPNYSRTNGGSIQQTTDGGYIISGYTNYYDDIESLGGNDIWIVKLAPDQLLTNDFNKKGFVLSPNPTRSKLNLQFSATTFIDKIIVTDLTGKEVLKQSEKTNQVDVQNLAKGMYILQAYSGKEKFTSKFIKE